MYMYGNHKKVISPHVCSYYYYYYIYIYIYIYVNMIVIEVCNFNCNCCYMLFTKIKKGFASFF